MGKIVYTTGTGIPPRSFDEEFMTHKKNSEWWYCTGYLEDGKSSFFSYQFTLAQVNLFGVTIRLLICSVTDFKTKKHYNIQVPLLFGKGVTTNDTLLSVDRRASVSFASNTHSSKGKMHLKMYSDEFNLEVDMEAVKPPTWHCDNGILQMGIPGEKERTYYYSFTNLKTSGSLTLGGRTYANMCGKTWFDRQGGTYSIRDSRTCWEWFSLRFFDNTEVMLFAFPQDNYYDGTYITESGDYHRLNDYHLESSGVITYEGKQFSNGWTVTINDKKYTITPKADGMFNVFFFELLADIKDENGELLGYCFVELLPGVRGVSEGGRKTLGLDVFRKK
ncbi:lipocalin-like domain-containing protein [Parasphaerochaeta coccoides]|uniref:AttH domain-containing protein n=1 Tax=Parasphaerochaeta coccoides (strain ATCC BAA-1237 / DSM 17374 / SPN1) TaxID=760011 RepID=F4GK26_PARC1|nr:lipocalin-like domain-containing protein [Parasphaerochaeta coccoides]AEC01798.1 hypothetical protein Spico_0570 [Parasphaerochaeta coccoides DSM 17374]